MARCYAIEAARKFKQGDRYAALQIMNEGMEYYAGRLQEAINGFPEPDGAIVAALLDITLRAAEAEFTMEEKLMKELLMHNTSVITCKKMAKED